MTPAHIIGGLVAWAVALLVCYVFVRMGSSGHTPTIEQRASKEALDFNAKLAARRHAELRGRAS